MRIHKLVTLGVVSLLMAACQGRPVGLVAEQGSTITIPLQNLAASTTKIGFGSYKEGAPAGSEVVPDPQRGSLRFWIAAGPGGRTNLETRGTSVVVPHPASYFAAEGYGVEEQSPQQIVSLVDIPETAPVGTYLLHVEHAYTNSSGTPVVEVVSYGGQVRVVAKPPSQAASPTPFQARAPFGQWLDISANVPDVVPRPEVRIGLSASVSSVELRVEVPDDVIVVKDAYHTLSGLVPMNRRALVWLTDEGLVTANRRQFRVSAASAHPGVTVDSLSVVFELVNPSGAILDPSTVTPLVLAATDAAGVPVSNVTATNDGVF